MGEKQEKKLKVTHCKGKETTNQAKDLQRQQQNQQIQNRIKPKAAANSKRMCAAGGRKNRGKNPGPQS
jgi:hypothetical protein